MTLTDLGNPKYIALETFRKNGQRVTTPVWAVEKNGKLYVWTDGDSWKAKRIRNNKKVRVCKSDARGNPQSDWIEAEARILDDAENIEQGARWMASKYGLQFRLAKLAGPLMGGGKNQVILEIRSA
jgi:PPOX class probable F420-dependent enzyme